MGITIDKAIDIMNHYGMYGLISQKRGRDKAVEIMCKYRRIKNIIFLTHIYTDEEIIEKIKELIKWE